MNLLRLFCLTVFVWTPRLTGDVLYSPVTVETTLGQYPTNRYGDEWQLTNIVNQSGLRLPFKSGNVGTNFFERIDWQQSTNDARMVWSSLSLTNQTLPAPVDFDFGTNLDVVQIIVWNWSVKDASFFLRSSPEVPWQLVKSVRLDSRLPNRSHPPTFLELDEPVNGRFLRIQIESVHPLSAGAEEEFAVLGEVMISARGQIQPSVTISQIEGEVWVLWTGIPLSSTLINGDFVDAFVGATGSSIPFYYQRDRWRVPPYSSLSSQFFGAK